tara:strand:- start:111 stop:527 length:417 start_codon:yes stop_codon:yes gene_type:complete
MRSGKGANQIGDISQLANSHNLSVGNYQRRWAVIFYIEGWSPARYNRKASRNFNRRKHSVNTPRGENMLDTSKLNPTAILRWGVTFDSIEAALERVEDGEGALVVARTLIGRGTLNNNWCAERFLEELNWVEALKAGQ